MKYYIEILAEANLSSSQSIILKTTQESNNSDNDYTFTTDDINMYCKLRYYKKILSKLYQFERKRLAEHGCKKVLMNLLKMYDKCKKNLLQYVQNMQNSKVLRFHIFAVK